MPQKRKAQRSAREREAAKRSLLEPGPSSREEKTVLLEESLEIPDSASVSASENEDLAWECVSSSSEECLSDMEFNCFSSTVVNQEVEIDFVSDEWESGFEWNEDFSSSHLSTETSYESRLPVMETTVKPAWCSEERWIADLCGVPLLAPGKRTITV